jgi:UDP-GlcNAc:undecaprenyl-phosphate GlcNAc-1-phosphate transferase
MWGDIAIAFTIAFVTAFMATPYSIRLAKRVGAVDMPQDPRRINKIVMPRLRRFGSNIRFFCIRNIFAYSNEY